MKVLFVIPYVPSLVRVRPYNFIRRLSGRGHRVTVLTVFASEQERREAEQLRQYCHRVIAVRLPHWQSWWNCLRALPGSKPLQAAYCWQPALLAQTAAADFDVIHVEHLRGAPYALELKSQIAALHRPLPIVWDSVDCISHLFRQTAAQSKKPLSRLTARLELRRTERYEGWLLKQFDRVLVTSSADREALLELSPDDSPTPISVAPNGVDLEYFRPGDGVIRDPATIVVSGKMSYHANVTMVLHLVEDIMPHVWTKCAEARLCIVGKAPPLEIRQLARNPGVTVTGAVADMRPYLQQATVAVVPLVYGAGSQFKMLEAMACATPVVCTPKAASAFEAAPDREVVVSKGPEAFAEQVLRLIGNPAEQRRIGDAGRGYVEKHHNWNTTVAQLERIYDELISAAH